MNEQRTLTDSLVRGLIMSFFVVLAAFLAYAWFAVSRESAARRGAGRAERAGIGAKRAAQARALSEYAVSYTAAGSVDTTKPVAIPIGRAMEAAIAEAAAHRPQAPVDRADALRAARSAEPAGAALYARDCASCHGADAAGGVVAKSLDEPLRLNLVTPPLLRADAGDIGAFTAALSDGRHTPPFGGYSGDEWRRLHVFLTTLVGTP